MSRSEVGKLESIQPRRSMDLVMLYIVIAILRFQLIVRIISIGARSRHFLLRFPYNLALPISFFHASALSDVARANMSSAMRRRHLKILMANMTLGGLRGWMGGAILVLRG